MKKPGKIRIVLFTLRWFIPYVPYCGPKRKGSWGSVECCDLIGQWNGNPARPSNKEEHVGFRTRVLPSPALAGLKIALIPIYSLLMLLHIMFRLWTLLSLPNKRESLDVPLPPPVTSFRSLHQLFKAFTESNVSARRKSNLDFDTLSSTPARIINKLICNICYGI